jgi:large conductance mechanosensitive channel
MLTGFVDFIKKQGVVGLAIGFILGGAVSKLVASLVTDLVNPIIGLLMGKVGNLANAALTIGSVSLRWGNFISVLIDFLIVAAVVYFGFKVLKLDQLDKPKQ